MKTVIVVFALLGCVLQAMAPEAAVSGYKTLAHWMNLGAIVSVFLSGSAYGTLLAETFPRRQ